MEYLDGFGDCKLYPEMSLVISVISGLYIRIYEKMGDCCEERVAKRLNGAFAAE